MYLPGSDVVEGMVLAIWEKKADDAIRRFYNLLTRVQNNPHLLSKLRTAEERKVQAQKRLSHYKQRLIQEAERKENEAVCEEFIINEELAAQYRREAYPMGPRPFQPVNGKPDPTLIMLAEEIIEEQDTKFRVLDKEEETKGLPFSLKNFPSGYSEFEEHDDA